MRINQGLVLFVVGILMMLTPETRNFAGFFIGFALARIDCYWGK